METKWIGEEMGEGNLKERGKSISKEENKKGKGGGKGKEKSRSLPLPNFFIGSACEC